MLRARIIHDCIRKLLISSPSDEAAMECLCRLLTTVGQALDKETKDRLAKGPIQGLVDLGSYFKEMMKLVEQKKTSARVRFMMQDVIELRFNGWKKRREDVVSKTIDEIHKQLEKKQIEKKRREGKKRSEEKEDKRILELEEFNKHAQSTEIRLYDAELKVKFLEKENSRLKKQQEFYINKAREWKNRALKYERTLQDKGIPVPTRDKGKNQVHTGCPPKNFHFL